MKKILVCSLMGVVFIALGCQGPGKQIIPEAVQDHQHFHSRTKAIGDYHAQLAVNHRRGKIYIVIYDINEDPKRIKARNINAQMTLSDGTLKDLSFEPDRYRPRRRRHRPHSYIYTIQGDWIKNVHRFKIKFLVPIKGNIYEVSYAYETNNLEDLHHKHDCSVDCPYY